MQKLNRIIQFNEKNIKMKLKNFSYPLTNLKHRY